MSTVLNFEETLDRPGFLSRENTIAKPGFNRWLVPPAALAIHLCIGMVYGLSVFWLPLSRALGHDKAIACANMSLIDALFTRSCDWRVSDPTARLNVNAADSGELVAVLCARRGAVCPVGSILARRRQSPLSDLAQMTGVAGVDTAVLRLLTVDGPGSVNVNAASSAVLLSLPGLSPEAAARLAERRALGRPITSLDALVSVLSSAARGMMVAQYADLARQVTFGPPVLLLTTRGWADGVGSAERLVATIEVLLVPLPTRLAVVRRRMW